MKNRVYFGHPINVYNTELEGVLIEKILNFFNDSVSNSFDWWVLENPNQRHHQSNCQIWSKEKGNVMDYFYLCVLPHCDAGIFMPFRDGNYGAGVYGEAKWMVENGRPIWEITHEGQIRKIENIQDIACLSVDETRKRIRDANQQPLPY